MSADTVQNPTSSCRYCGANWSDTCKSHEGGCRWYHEAQTFVCGSWNDYLKLDEWWVEFG